MMSRLFLATLILLTTYCFGQSPKEQLKIANAGSVRSSDFYEEIPFMDKGGYYIIPVTIGSETYNYLFDTGGYNTVTTQIMKKHQLPELMKVSVGSSNQIESKILLSNIPQLNIGGVTFDDVGVFNFDFDESPLIKCFTNGGLLGKGVIKEAVWQIDYQSKVIRLADKVEKMPNLDNSIKLKVELDKTFNPFIQVEMNGRKQQFMLDFGYGGFISLTAKTASECIFTNTMETIGEGTIGANGVSKAAIFISNLASFEIGGQEFHNQVVYHAASNNYNLIGGELAQYFIVTLNFKEKELILTPIKSISTEPFRTFGLDINVNEREIYVSRIYKGHNAMEKSIKLNDIILSINETPVDSLNLCGSFFALRKELNESEILTLELDREGKRTKVELHKTGM